MVLAIGERMKGRCADWTGCGRGVWYPRGDLLLEGCLELIHKPIRHGTIVEVRFEMESTNRLNGRRGGSQCQRRVDI